MEQTLSYANLVVGNSISTNNTSQNREVVIPGIKLELALSYLIEYQLLLQKDDLSAVSFLGFEGNLCGNIKSDKLTKLNDDLIKGLSNLKFHLFGKRGVNDFESLQNVLDPLAKKERKKIILSSLAVLSTGLILGPMVIPYAYAQLPIMMRLVSSGLIVSTIPSSYQTAKTIFDLVNEDNFKMIGHSRKLLETLKMILSPGLSLQNLMQLVVIYESSLKKDFEINHPLKWGETWLSDLKKKYSRQEIIDLYLERHQIISIKLESL